MSDSNDISDKTCEVLDVDAWINNYYRVQKPPFNCIICNHKYHSHTGIFYHLRNRDHNIGQNTPGKPLPKQFLPPGVKNPEPQGKVVKNQENEYLKRLSQSQSENDSESSSQILPLNEINTEGLVKLDKKAWLNNKFKYEPPPYRCPLCGHAYESMTGIQYHLRNFNHHLNRNTPGIDLPDQYLPTGMTNPEKPELTQSEEERENRYKKTFAWRENDDDFRKRKRKKRRSNFSNYAHRIKIREMRRQQYDSDSSFPSGASPYSLPGNRIEVLPSRRGTDRKNVSLEVRNPNIRQTNLSYEEAQHMVEIDTVPLGETKGPHRLARLDIGKDLCFDFEELDLNEIDDDASSHMESEQSSRRHDEILEEIARLSDLEFGINSPSKRTRSKSMDQPDTPVKGKKKLFQPRKNIITTANATAKKPLPDVQLDTDLVSVKSGVLPKSYQLKEELPYEVIEYDLDDEDTIWLEAINERRRNVGHSDIPEALAERLIDEVERESVFELSKKKTSYNPTSSSVTNSPEFQDETVVPDDEAVCCICGDGSCTDTNQILFCEMCNIAVHQECYGIPYIPESAWLCQRCLHSPSKAVSCVLCPNKTGAFKPVNGGRGWCHISCALWIPEVLFGNSVFLEPIENIERVPQKRFSMKCTICRKSKVGACIQCCKSNCFKGFHVTCGQKAGLYMNMETQSSYGAQGQQTVQCIKTAYCLMHSPENWSPKPIRSTEVVSKRKKSRKDDARNRAVQSLSEKPLVSAPYVPTGKVGSILAHLSDVRDRGQFLQNLLSYWTQKRQARSGAPLLKRLQNKIKGANRAVNFSPSIDALRENLQYWKTLRQDLERVRLLFEIFDQVLQNFSR